MVPPGGWRSSREPAEPGNRSSEQRTGGRAAAACSFEPLRENSPGSSAMIGSKARRRMNLSTLRRLSPAVLLALLPGSLAAQTVVYDLRAGSYLLDQCPICAR